MNPTRMAEKPMFPTHRSNPSDGEPDAVKVARPVRRGGWRKTSRSSPAIGGAVPTQCKYALNWTRLSCHRFVANQVRLWLFVLAYNLGNFMRRLTLPESAKHWSLRSVQTKLIKMGGRLVRHAWRLVFSAC